MISASSGTREYRLDVGNIPVAKQWIVLNVGLAIDRRQHFGIGESHDLSLVALVLTIGCRLRPGCLAPAQPMPCMSLRQAGALARKGGRCHGETESTVSPRSFRHHLPPMILRRNRIG